MDTMDLKDKLFLDEKKANSPWSKLKRNKTAMIGLVIVIAMILLALLSPVFAPHDPNEMNLSKVHLKPGVEGHIFGTDDVGRDVLSRIIYGARISMLVAIGGTLVGGLIGIFLGLISF